MDSRRCGKTTHFFVRIRAFRTDREGEMGGEEIARVSVGTQPEMSLVYGVIWPMGKIIMVA